MKVIWFLDSNEMSYEHKLHIEWILMNVFSFVEKIIKTFSIEMNAGGIFLFGVCRYASLMLQSMEFEKKNTRTE